MFSKIFKKNKIDEELCNNFLDKFKDYINNNKNKQQRILILKEKYSQEVISQICNTIINYLNCTPMFNSISIPIIDPKKEYAFIKKVDSIVQILINDNITPLYSNIDIKNFDKYLDEYTPLTWTQRPKYTNPFLMEIVNQKIDECMNKYTNSMYACTSGLLPSLHQCHNLSNIATPYIHQMSYPDYNLVKQGRITNEEFEQMLREYYSRKYNYYD